MRYLFSFGDIAMAELFCRAMQEAGIVCEIRTAHQFPDGTQGPELWIRDEDYDRAEELLCDLQNER